MKYCCLVDSAVFLEYRVTMRSLSALLFLSLAAAADEGNLLLNSSFEAPVVQARTAETDGANPVRAEEGTTSWAHFQSVVRPQDKAGGQIIVGLTNEIARTGKQSVFVDFQNVTATKRRSFLMTDLVPVKAGQIYRIGIWGRTDRKRPLTLDQRRPYLRVEVEYFTPDQESQAGSTDNRNEFIPGRTDQLFFVSSKWMEYHTTVRTPEDAGFMKVSFRWETGGEPGTTDGAIYFDDASLQAVAGGEIPVPLDPAAIKATPAEPEKPEAPKEKP
jgi:hypothetical protein